MKNLAAVELGRKRWAKVSKSERTAHALRMLAGRKDRKTARKAAAKA